jgi:hypothetical protein
MFGMRGHVSKTVLDWRMHPRQQVCMIGSRSKPACVCCTVSGDEKLVTSHEAWTYYGDLTIRLRCGLEVRDSKGLYHASGSCCHPGKSGSGRRHVVHPGASDRFAGALYRLSVLYISILCVPASLDSPPVAFGLNNHDRSQSDQRSLQQLSQSPHNNYLNLPTTTPSLHQSCVTKSKRVQRQAQCPGGLVLRSRICVCMVLCIFRFV